MKSSFGSVFRWCATTCWQKTRTGIEAITYALSVGKLSWDLPGNTKESCDIGGNSNSNSNNSSNNSSNNNVRTKVVVARTWSTPHFGI